MPVYGRVNVRLLFKSAGPSARPRRPAMKINDLDPWSGDQRLPWLVRSVTNPRLLTTTLSPHHMECRREEVPEWARLVEGYRSRCGNDRVHFRKDVSLRCGICYEKHP